MGVLLIGGLVMGAIIVALLIILITVRLRDEEMPSDDTEFENFMSQYSQGYSRGPIIDVQHGHSRTGITFLPKDVDKLKLLRSKDIIEIKPQTVYFENNKLIPFPKGTFGDHKNKMWGLPPTAEDVPERLKRLPEGKVIMQMIEATNGEAKTVEIMRKRIENTDALAKETVGLQTVHDSFTKVHELNKDITKVTPEGKKDSKFGLPGITGSGN